MNSVSSVSTADADVVRRALARVTVWPPDLDPDDRYASVGELVAGGLAERVCHRLGDPPLRVGESAVVMGVASRLWSVLVVPAARDRVLVDPAALCARDDDGAVVLGVRPGPGPADPSADDVATTLHAVLDPVVAAFDLAPRLLWGNVAASLHAVPRVHGVPEAVPLVADLLARAPLAGELDELGGGHARRRTCCLFYLVPGGGLCGDCVLDAVPRG